jgi:hypothetical protein
MFVTSPPDGRTTRPLVWEWPGWPVSRCGTGVRINELQPGVIATELSKTDPVGTAVAQSKVPMGRSG